MNETSCMAGRFSRRCVAVCLMLAMASWAAGSESTKADPPQDRKALTEISLEELMNVKVTTVSKKEESQRTAPAAIFVITQDDIRRSGATTIMRALRLVPGLDVARLTNDKWAISSRGFNALYANKLLVLIDGRSIYAPLFNGVFWDVQDTLLADIDRIEVIRGPGGTLWGANAVNGIINIITKNAKDSQGGLVSAGAGTEERGFGSFRYGGKISNDTYYRLYAKYFDRDGSAPVPDFSEDWDEWRAGQMGFRVDSNLSTEDTLTVQGDAYRGLSKTIIQRVSPWPPYLSSDNMPMDCWGENILMRWRHDFSKISDITLQLYYDQAVRHEDTFHQSADTIDLDFQHHFALGERHDIVWGIGYRNVRLDAHGDPFRLEPTPEQRVDNHFNAFIQDEIALVPDKLKLTLGSKIELNDYTGTELQPSIRLAWTPDEKQMWWAAVSRATGTPSWLENSGRLTLFSFPFGLGFLRGDRGLPSESLVAYEIGYRRQLSKRLVIDIATFYNDYSKLRTAESGTPFFELFPLPPHLAIPAVFGANMEGQTWGGELAVAWHPTERLRIRSAYSLLNTDFHLKSVSNDTMSMAAATNSPKHQVSIDVGADVTKNVEVDAQFRYVDSLHATATSSYFNLDLRLGWHPSKNFEFAVVGQNLLESRRAQYKGTQSDGITSQIERGVYAEATWRF